MESLLENAPDIIASAATNPLGLAALVIIVSGVIALYWFRQSTEWIRLSIFSLLFVGGLLFAYASGLETPTVVGSAAPNIVEPSIEENVGNTIAEDRTKGVSPSNDAQSLNESEAFALVEEEGYTFSLYTCSRNTKSNLNCVLKVENNENERRDLTLYNSYFQEESKIVDSSGKIYFAESLVFGSVPNNRSVTQEMTRTVPVEAEVAFADVPENLTSMKLVEFLFAGSQTFPVQFFDVPLFD